MLDRRSFLTVLGALPFLNWLAGCATSSCDSEQADGSAYSGCEDAIVPAEGIDQYEALRMLYGDQSPETAMAFKVLRDDQFVFPSEAEFQIDAEEIWRYYFQEGEVVVFFQL